MWYYPIFVFYIVLVSVQGAPENQIFELTFQRFRNELILHCNAQNGSMATSITFLSMIATNLKDIKSTIIIPNRVVRFIIQPQYEGTFYCGQVNETMSQGITIAGD